MMPDWTDAIDSLRTEAKHYRPGSPDWQYRRRAAWSLTQHGEGIPTDEWTDPPADFWAETERKAA